MKNNVFKGWGYDESKDLTIIRMCGSVSDLCVRAGVPVWVIDDDSIGSSQIDSQTSDFSGQQEDKNGFVLQERQKNHLPRKQKQNSILFTITFITIFPSLCTNYKIPLLWSIK